MNILWVEDFGGKTSAQKEMVQGLFIDLLGKDILYNKLRL